MNLYISLIQSHLSYGILLWGKNSQKAFITQKRAIRLISFSNYRDHTDPLFKTLNILKVSDIYKLGLLTFYYKLQNHELPAYFMEMNPVITENNNLGQLYNFRHIRVTFPICRLEKSKNCLRYQLVKILDVMPNAIHRLIETETLNSIKNMIKLYLIGKYKLTCDIVNCFVCNRYDNQ